MNVFDSEPYLSLLPRRWFRPLASAALLAVAFIPSARHWWVEQAEQHVHNQIQPLVRQLDEKAEAAAPPATSKSPGSSKPNR